MIRVLALIVFLFDLGTSILFSQNYSISTFDNTWCTGAFPTAYVTGSWSITETDISGNFGLTKNQTAQTFIVDLPAGFEFKTAGTTAAVTIGPSGVGGGAGLDFSSVSFVFTSVTRVTVTLTSKNQQLEYNSLNFNDFEIRATSAATGNMVRNGGSFQVDNSTANPTASEPFGTFTAGSPYAYSSTTVSQAQDGVNVAQYSINNEILQIKINGTGSCSGTVSQIDLSTVGTAGTDLASNITTAKIYYTGSSSTFATTTLFGTLSSPSGAFFITGSQDLLNGDNYFWLTYDVPGDANTDAVTPLNRLDAQLVSFVLSGSTITTSFTTPNPAGSRPIIGAAFYYSRENGTWNNSTTRWATTDGGPACSCQPSGSGVAVIKHAITLDAARTVDVVEIRTGATLTDNGTNKNLIVNSSLNTAGTGYFSLRSDPLTVLGNVTLDGTGASTNSRVIDINGDLTIGAGTSLANTTNNLHIYVGGSLTVDGTFSSATNGNIYMDGGYVTLSGSGTISPSSSFIVNANNKTIPAGATFTVTAPFEIQGAYTITNNGSVTLSGNLNGDNASSQWTNAASSTLNYGGSSIMFSTNGKLDASANGNTVNYNRAGNQSIVRPANSGKYIHLTLSGGGTKTLDQNISVSGNWVNNATFNASSQAVLLNGNSQQVLSGSSSIPFALLEVDNSTPGSAILLSTPISVSTNLTLTDGHIISSSANTLTMGASGGVTLNCSPQDSSFVKGPMKHTVNVSTSVTKVFPIGAGNSYRRADLTIDQNATTTTLYTAEMFNSSAIALGYTLPGTLTWVSGMRHFQIDQSVATGLDNAQVRIYFGCSGINDYVEELPTLAIAKDDGAGNWIDLSGTAAGGICGGLYYAGDILSGSFTTFSKFTLANKVGGVNPLPVDFLSFEAEPNGNNVNLTWTTETESNSDYFTVQRSTDGNSFEEVASVGAAGYSSMQKQYSAVDYDPHPGLSYYRIKQVDRDGKIFFTSLVAVNFGSQGIIGMSVFPNPAEGPFNISLTGWNGKQTLIVVRDMQGKEYYSKILLLANDAEVIAIDPSGKLNSGVYVVVASAEESIFEKKIIIR